MLRPGPGTPPEEVAQNQRERLFGAMVASVSERGYFATRVSDLVELSGVSSRSFYDLFPDKRACFLATIEAILRLAVEAVVDIDRGSNDWEERLRRGFEVFGKMIANQPAAARLCVIDAFAGGPEVLKPLDDAYLGFEVMARHTLERSPERAGMPPEMITAQIGALMEIARTRLRTGREAELPGLRDDLVKQALPYLPPPRPLRSTTRLPPARPESLEAHDHEERVLRAFAVVVSEQGYAETTVDQVVKRASMSATTFYANFDGKEDAMLAAIDSACAQAVAAAVPAFRRNPDWADGVRAGFAALLNFLASRPALARLATIEVYAAGPKALERRVEALRPLGALIAAGLERSPEITPIAVELMAGGIYALLFRQIRDSGAETLPGLAPVCTYIVLVPFLGPEEACAVANGEGRGRGGNSRKRSG